MEDIMKIVKSLEDSGLLLKRVTEAIQNKAKEQKGVFVSTLLGTLLGEKIQNKAKEQKGVLLSTLLGAGLLGNMLPGKEINRAGDGMIRAGYGSKRSSVQKKF